MFRDVTWDVEDWESRVYSCLLCKRPRIGPGSEYRPGWVFAPLEHSRARLLLHLMSFHHVHLSVLRALSIQSDRGPVKTYLSASGERLMTSEPVVSYRHGDSWRVRGWDSGIKNEFQKTHPDYPLIPPRSEAELANRPTVYR